MMKADVNQPLIDSLGDDDPGGRKAVTGRFGENQYVGLEIEVLAIKPLAATSKTCLGLIDDKQGTNLLRECLQLGEVFRRRIYHSPRRYYRFDDDRSDVVRAIPEHAYREIQAAHFAFRIPQSNGTAITVRRDQMVGFRRLRARINLPLGDRTQASQRQRDAVVSAVESHCSIAVGKRLRHAERKFVRLRACREEKDP